MNRVQIAQVAHEVNQGMRAALGEAVELWADATPEQKASVLAGVDMHIANPDTTPEASHEAWLAQKTAEGWSYGEVKDIESKVHPCFLPYAELPPEQKVKDYLFRAVVHALKDIADATPTAQRKLLSVKYIGPRETYTDGTFGSGIAFVKGQSRMVPADLAQQMFAHPSVYVPGDAVDDLAEPKVDTSEEDHAQDLRDSIATMGKAAVQTFVKTHFNQTLDKGMTVAEMRTRATGLVDQFGLT